jgi:hypothetical protein
MSSHWGLERKRKAKSEPDMRGTKLARTHRTATCDDDINIAQSELTYLAN